MGLKEWPYWLKGGLVLVIVQIVLIILAFLIGMPIPTFSLLAATFVESFYFVYYLPPILFFLISIVEAFIIGIILGLIYGKIRAEPKSTQKVVLIGAIIGLVIAWILVGFANMDFFPLLTNILFLGLREIIGQAEASIIILSVIWIAIGIIVGWIIGRMKSE